MVFLAGLSFFFFRTIAVCNVCMHDRHVCMYRSMHDRHVCMYRGMHDRHICMYRDVCQERPKCVLRCAF